MSHFKKPSATDQAAPSAALAFLRAPRVFFLAFGWMCDGLLCPSEGASCPQSIFFQSFPKRGRQQASRSSISCNLVCIFFFSLSKMKRSFQEMSACSLSSRAVDYFSTCGAIPRPLGPGNGDRRGLLCHRNRQNRQKTYFPCERCRTGARSGLSTLCLNYFESLKLYIRSLRPLCERADKLSAHLTPIKLTATVYLSSLLSRRTIASLQRAPQVPAGQFSCRET